MTLSMARRAERFPDRTALVDTSEERLYAPAETIHENRVTYGELAAIVDRTAQHLTALGIGAGDTVCLLTRNRVASLAIYFACRRLEAAFAPISHWLTPVTVERPFAVLDPDLVVSEAAQRDLVRSIPFDRSVTLEELANADRAPISDENGADHDGRDEPDGRSDDTRMPLAIFHGTEGRPVVGYTERTLEWNCISALLTWDLSRTDVAPLVAPLSSVAGLVRVALPLLYVGGTVLLDRAFDPGDTLTAIGDERATVLAGNPRPLEQLAAEPGFAEAAASLDRTVVEHSMSDDARTRYRDAGVSLANAYGRLECPTALSQSFDAVDDDATETASPVVGRPVVNCRARIVDDAGSVLAGESEGELELSGSVVADGYVDPAGIADGNWTVSLERQREAVDNSGSGDESDEVDGDARLSDGWLHTEQSVRRTEDGDYQLR
ncbi:AMP-dependent synthetase [Natronorubrum daqingense]|uniref:AMP-dependent synthetase n=1 Tax=Natronorubrum daqingense TaxID=588898 RepID=A0A1P8RHX9_9EURY|nr:AMP-dependent synthetase [Natronorubrum daqingense]